MNFPFVPFLSDPQIDRTVEARVEDTTDQGCGVVSRCRRRRKERGAIAIMTAAMATLLLLIGAMGVDLGNAMNRKQLTQNSADFAALARG